MPRIVTPASTGVQLPHYRIFTFCMNFIVALSLSEVLCKVDMMSSSKVIILTGASRGIGLAMAKYLLKASHRVVLVARSAEPLESLKSQYPRQVEMLAADLSDLSVGFFFFWFLSQ